MSTTQSRDVNRKMVLAQRPKGAPTTETFRFEQEAVPQPQDGQVLLRTVYLSLDPYMRGRMNDGPSYAVPVAVGGVMVGGTVCRVEASRHKDFAAGDWVFATNGWQDYALSDGTNISKLDSRIPKPTYALGVLGMPGFTAYMGLLDIGAPKPNETVVVAAATGAVGAVVGQIAKLKGCRVVGIAGGPEKCRFAVKEFGFDICIDHRDPNFPKLLAEACAQGIDVYFENVGGAVFDAVVPLLNVFARIPVCGLIAQYNWSAPPPGPDRRPGLMGLVLQKRLKIQGYIISDYNARINEFHTDMTSWVQSGKVKTKEDIVLGLENAPQALIGLLEGKNFGKLVIQVGEP